MARPYCSQCGAKNNSNGDCTNTTCPRYVAPASTTTTGTPNTTGNA